MGLLMFSRAELQYLNVEHPVEIKDKSVSGAKN